MNSISLRRAVLGSIVSVSALVALGTAGLAEQTSSSRIGVRACSAMKGLHSEHSREPTAITFVNKSGMYRGLNWIDFKGHQKSYGGLNPGEKKTINTFRTHPWVVTTGPGDCVKIYMPAAEPSSVTLK